MAHKNHYAHCGYCGWTGEEDELPPDDNHVCGKDQCPECKQEGFISCCYKSLEGAEIKDENDIETII